MKKLKNLWVENRVLFVLFITVIVCIFIIIGVCVKYFFGSSDSSYGERLEGIEKVEVTNDIKNNYLNKMKEDTSIKDVSILNKGRIIYITLNFNEPTTLIEAESKALSSLENFDENYQAYYDFNITLKQDESSTSSGFLIMGAKNANGTGLSWNNNTEVNNGE